MSLGFKVDRSDGVDGAVDEFGDYEHFPVDVEYEKNGVSISLV